MIWQSIPLMTIFDIMIVMIAFASLGILFRQRHMLTQSGLLVGTSVVVAGLIVIGSFYFVDLFIMWVLPIFISHSRSMAIMETMYLNYSWVVMFVATVSIFIGFTFVIQKIFLQTTKLREEITQHKQTEDELKVSNKRFGSTTRENNTSN